MAPDQDLTRVPMYTASEVEARTGVPATTLRQWERRYDFPRPVRNASGYRLYSPQDVLEIGWMQAHLRRGVAARRAAELARAGRTDPVEGREAGDPQELASRLTGALLDSNLQASAAILDETTAQMSQETMLLSVISPCLVEIGRRWVDGEITIAHEHQASAFLRSRLSAMMNAAEVGSSGIGNGREPLVVAACAPGEQHELGLMMITLALQRRGVRVAYVGPNVPLDDLATYTRGCGAQGLALCMQGDWALEPMRAGREALDVLDVPIFFGGALLNQRPELARALRGVYAGPDAAGAAGIIIQVVEARRRNRRAPADQAAAQATQEKAAQAQAAQEEWE